MWAETSKIKINKDSPMTLAMTVAWKACSLCSEQLAFKSPRDFCIHLREYHCIKEGGSYVCRYGANNVCATLPIEGVSDRDYEDHVARDHITIAIGKKVPNQIEQTKDRMTSQCSSSASSRSSTPTSREPSVVQDGHKWTIFNSKVNLPAILNDPRIAKRENDLFTKTWGVEFERPHIYPSSYIPEIRKEDFKRYVHKISARLRFHQSISQDPHNTSSLTDNKFPELLTAKRMSNEQARSELEQIPKLYLLPNFTLDNPDTFNAVFPWQQIQATRHGDTKGPKQSAKLLQEKMSHYLDIVEVQIARQISLRSEAFFHAMSSHDELQDNMKCTCEAITELRGKMRRIETNFVENPLKILKYSRSKTNLLKLYHKLKLMSTIHMTQPTIQTLLATNDFVGAIDLINTSQEVLTQELLGVHSFRHLGSQLVEMEKLINKMVQADFIRYSFGDLNRPLSDSQYVMEEDRLGSIVFGMLRQHRFTFLGMYKEEACTGLKAVMKQTIIECVSVVEDDDSENNIGSLADQMRLLNYPQWMNLLYTIFKNMLIVLQRAKATCLVISRVVSIAAGKSIAADDDGETSSHLSHSLSIENDNEIMLSESDHSTLISDVREMLSSVCDAAHDRCVKVMSARSKDGFLEKLSSSEFVSLSKAVEKFVGDCEAVCGRKSTSLRGCLQSQANRFVNRFHEERKQKLSLILENERWKQADVPAEFQELVKSIELTGVLKKSDKSLDAFKKPADVLVIKNEKYAVVGTVLILLKIIVEYCQCVDDIPGIAGDLLTRLIELLKIFNSRSCQLILGAGALQLVGLKKISTKNLVLALRCLQVIELYIPLIKTHFEDRLIGKQCNLIKHFDQVLKDYKDHIVEINTKLVAIMSGMIEDQLQQWEVKAPMPSASVRMISKQICKFHEAVIDLLPNNHLKDIFKEINESFKNELRKQLIKFNVRNDGGPQHGLVTADLAHYIDNVKTLPGLQSVANDMNKVWIR